MGIVDAVRGRGEGWERLKDVLRDGGERRQGPFVGRWGEVEDEEGIERVLRGVEGGRRARWEGGEGEVRGTVKGLMRVVGTLRWRETSKGGRTVDLERVACFGLKEEVRWSPFG